MINRYFLKRLVLSLSVSLCILNIFAEEKNGNREFLVSKNMDIYNSLFKELDMFYVDTINPEKTIKTGIDAMLNSLDPYTVYIPEEEMEDFKFMMSGEYAGVGAIIAKHKNAIIVNEIYEGKPADKCGLKVGDKFIEIAGKKIGEDKSTSDVSNLLRGDANTVVEVVVERPGEKKPLKLKITREKIALNPIEYYDVLDNNIGFISVSNFTDKTASSFKEAFLDLKKRGVTSLIIDLRSNPGGLLSEALQIVNYFVPKGSTLLTTRGKVKQWDETYKATSTPIDTEIPLAVIVNKGSASASEVVAGALQDLDRAVVIGERSYGKGLVQTTRSLPYGGGIKVTTSKYYTPSGRCVQAIDYSDRDENGYVKRIPDSLTTEFKTANGRIVRDGGGITPDSVVEIKDSYSELEKKLVSDNIIFDYAVNYHVKHKNIAPPKEFVFNDYDDFKKFVKDANFTYTRNTEKGVKALVDIAKKEGYYEIAKEEFDALEKKLEHDIDKDLEHFKKDVKWLVTAEILSKYYYKRGFLSEMVKEDVFVDVAKKILNDKEAYKKILSNP